jgi:hypothetical protein
MMILIIIKRGEKLAINKIFIYKYYKFIYKYILLEFIYKQIYY